MEASTGSSEFGIDPGAPPVVAAENPHIVDEAVAMEENTTSSSSSTAMADQHSPDATVGGGGDTVGHSDGSSAALSKDSTENGLQSSAVTSADSDPAADTDITGSTTPVVTGPHNMSADNEREEAVRFKRLKLSHRRSYRSHDEVTAVDSPDEVPAVGGEEEEDVEMGLPSTSTDNKESQIPVPALQQIRNEYLNHISSSESSDDEGPPRPDRSSRVTARRIVRAEDLDLTTSSDSSDEEEEEERRRRQELGEEEEDTDSHQEEYDEDQTGEVAAAARELLHKLPPPPRFNFCKDYQSRLLGSRLVPRFTDRFIASTDSVKRFEIRSKLNGHDGCVNALHFNSMGTKIASGSDDMCVIIWDWEREQKLLTFNTGHKANVFQSKFLPGDLLVTTCSRDGQVRLAELSVTGSLRSTKKLVQHRGPVHKLTLIPDEQHLVLSAGEDGQVMSIDLREEKPNKILHLKNEREKQIPLFSIHNNPVNSWEFCTAGRDQYMRIFDRRSIGQADPVSRFCPEELETTADNLRSYLTAAVFSHDGSEILGSYNDDDIYLFPTATAAGGGPKRFRGHRNSATVKGVNFYGPRSEYVISGSDCGNIFFWAKETGAVVNIVPGDERGVVNVLEIHPSLPVIATSGLDEDVKVWMPTFSMSDRGSARATKEKSVYISKTVHRNLADQEKHRMTDTDSIDGQMLWDLWRHIRRASRRRRRRDATMTGEQASDDTEEDDDDVDEDDSEEGPGARGIGCVQS